MDLLIAILLFLGATVGAIATNVLASELYDWTPIWARRLIELAVLQLPDSCREQYREEWLAHLEELPGGLHKLRHALGCRYRAAPRIASEKFRLPSAMEETAEKAARWLVKLLLKLVAIHFLIRPALRGEFLAIRWCWIAIDALIDQAHFFKKKHNASREQVQQQMQLFVEDLKARFIASETKNRTDP